MKDPKDHLAEMQMDDDILFNRHEVSVWLSDFIKEIQKDAYNYALNDVCLLKEFDGFVDKESVMELKIK